MSIPSRSNVKPSDPTETARNPVAAFFNRMGARFNRISTKRELFVREPVGPSELPELAKIASAWESQAWDRRSYPKVGEIYSDLANNATHIAGRLRHIGLSNGYHLFICQDVALNQIQAIALVDNRDPNRLIVEHIITHPDNVRCKENRSILTRVEGAGSKLIKHLAAIALKEDKTIYLESTASSLPFYRKLGFTETTTTELDLLTPMQLKTPAIQALASSTQVEQR